MGKLLGKPLYDKVCQECSRMVTHRYSTSFSMGVRALAKRHRPAIYAIYGFVRFADEIVDTFHEHKQASLLHEFEGMTWKAIRDRISLNPILNSFQEAVHAYRIDEESIATFIRSMRMDLDRKEYDQASYESYILGSAEVVGLMCLRVFVDGDDDLYNRLKPSAMRLGAAFQKINFLRDLKDDVEELGRSYFPSVDVMSMDGEVKARIEQEIRADFDAGLEGIRQLPRSSRFGVYMAYAYYRALFRKISDLPPQRILNERIRIPNPKKYSLLVGSYMRHQFNMI